jgi:hypothetical protein
MELPRRTLRQRASAHHASRALIALVLSTGILLAANGGASAQDTTPPATASPGTSPVIAFDLLYVQTFAVSHVEPGADDVVVRLSRASGQTMYIEGLQDRRVGTLPTAEFLQRLDASLAAPPYAAVLGQDPDGSQTLIVGQVMEGTQVDPQTFEYRLRLVPDEVDIDLEVDAERLDAVTEPLDMQLTYILFTGVEGCPPWETAC